MLLNPATKKMIEEGKCSEEDLGVVPYAGVDTIFKALKYNLERMPDTELLGIKSGKSYTWLTWKQVFQMAEQFSAGLNALDGAITEMEADGRSWKLYGIQARNQKEWVVASLAGMFGGLTTVAINDNADPKSLTKICAET